MNREKLQMLADLLRNEDALNATIDVFDMRVYYAPYQDNGCGGCGTSACAAGYAALRPEFPDLTLEHPEEEGTSILHTPTGRTEMGALCECFDITIYEIDQIFYKYLYFTAEQVADKIESILESQE